MKTNREQQTSTTRLAASNLLESQQSQCLTKVTGERLNNSTGELEETDKKVCILHQTALTW